MFYLPLCFSFSFACAAQTFAALQARAAVFGRRAALPLPAPAGALRPAAILYRLPFYLKAAGGFPFGYASGFAYVQNSTRRNGRAEFQPRPVFKEILVYLGVRRLFAEHDPAYLRIAVLCAFIQRNIKRVLKKTVNLAFVMPIMIPPIKNTQRTDNPWEGRLLAGNIFRRADYQPRRVFILVPLY